MSEYQSIPKCIHYIWLGGAALTPSVRKCIDSWKRIMPDYEIKRWDETNFDIDSVPWVKEAVSVKKWAFAADYIRQWALYNEGGIYMDTDVKVLRPFDEFLHWDFFSSVEYHKRLFRAEGVKQIDGQGIPLKNGGTVAGIGILSALFGAKRGNPFIKECLDFLGSRHFIREDGSLETDSIIPGIMAMIATRYGFRYRDVPQLLDGNMMICDSSVFAGSEWDSDKKKNYAIHYADGSWRDLSFGKDTMKIAKKMVPGCLRRLIDRFYI